MATDETEKFENKALDDKDEISQESRLTVVGIGASAGGLTALRTFFDALANDTGMAFVVVTHMAPDQESLLPELLQKHTGMKVSQVQELIAVEPDHVYVIPPGQRIVLTDTHLDVEEFDEPRGRRMPIDHFFRSLATVHHDAVAVILSGGGTDGAVGIKAIKAHGGLLMVQHPDEAEHEGMPKAAINTGLADVVLPAAQLAEKLMTYRQNGVHFSRDPDALTGDEVETVYRILTQVQIRTGHDFSQYKRSTILRRIHRRMQLHGQALLPVYLEYLRHNGEEAVALFNDLLIGVTNFFRDRQSWDALAEKIIPRLFEGKDPDEPVRVWTIGCSTGEEAYTMAILLKEHVASMQLPSSARPAIQVFASDLDDAALKKAREGMYPEVIETDVSPERLERFFTKDGNYYHVKRELRDIVLFSNHSVLRDPPFSRLDLISCRNLLIYLQRDLQQVVFQIFHYALRPERYLFLGSSESADMVEDLFHVLDKTHRVYQARPRRGDHPPVPSLPLKHPRPASVGNPISFSEHPWPGERIQSTAVYHLELLEKNAPPSILVNQSNQILHLSQSAGRYLLHPGGEVTNELLKVVRPELQLELRTALFQAFEKQQSVLSQSIYVQFNGTPHRVAIAVRPQAVSPGSGEEDAGNEQLALVFFLENEFHETGEESALRGGGDTRHESVVAQLESEIRRQRDQLQSTSEEYESSNEELKSANEELQSINEEYRSATEELETSKEELQSVNEELQTVNAELKNKLEEISRAHSDLENLLASTEIATLFLDRDLRIQRYTPSTVRLFNIMPGDRGRPIQHLTNTLGYEKLVEDAQSVLRTLIPIEHEMRDITGKWLLARIRPYRTIEDRIEGVVLTFVDITDLKEAEQALRQSQGRLQKILQIGTVGVIFFDESGSIVDANETFLEQIGCTRDDLETGELSWQKLTPPEWVESSNEQIEKLNQAGLVGPYEKEYFRKDGSRWWFLFAGARLDDGTIVEFCVDINRQKDVEKALIAEKEHSEKIIHTVREGLLVLKPDLTVEFANDSFYEMFQVNRQATEGSYIYDLGNGQWDIPQLRLLLEEILPEQNVFNDYRVEHQFEDVGRRIMVLNARRLDHIERILLAIEDVTDRLQYEEELKRFNEKLERLVVERTVQVRRLASELMSAEQSVRQRIAQTLHDDLQQMIYAVKVQVQLLLDQAGEDEDLDDLSKLIDQSLDLIHQITVELSPPVLDGTGLLETLQWLAEHMEKAYKLNVNVTAAGRPHIDSEERRILIYQVVRELLFNVVKHAGVREAQVTLEETAGGTRITVSDSGQGFDVAALAKKKRNGGFGLRSAHERLQLFGGRADIDSQPGGGTRIVLFLPHPPALDEAAVAGQ